ncbi:lytTr DNA-binding domain protein, partial [Vibrio harveyi]
KATRH